jgi:hypothetical protein
MDSTGMPIIVVLLLSLVSVAMVNPKVTFLAMLATVGVYLAFRFSAPLLATIPAEYWAISSLGALGGALGLLVIQRLTKA